MKSKIISVLNVAYNLAIVFVLIRWLCNLPLLASDRFFQMAVVMMIVSTVTIVSEKK